MDEKGKDKKVGEQSEGTQGEIHTSEQRYGDNVGGIGEGTGRTQDITERLREVLSDIRMRRVMVESDVYRLEGQLRIARKQLHELRGAENVVSSLIGQESKM